MKILLIDNGTRLLRSLLDMLNEHTVSVVFHNHLHDLDLSLFDLIILSGSSEYPVAGNDTRFKDELNIIRESSKPIMGICLGFELIAHAFGGILEPLKQREKGVIPIEAILPLTTLPFASHVKRSMAIPLDGKESKGTKELKEANDAKKYRVYVCHQWAITKLSKELIPLAVSKHSIEIAKHRIKPIYGFQFHPEVLIENNDGREIFKSYLVSFERTAKSPTE